MNRLRDPLPCLTGLRFFAALAVAVGHFSYFGLLRWPHLMAITKYPLDVRPAVVLFFILSGFILTYNYDGILTRAGLASYFINRFARIYPIYVFCLVLSAILVVSMTLCGNTGWLAWFSLTHSHHVARDLVVSMCALLLFLTAWIPVLSIDQPWNGLSWSLSCEAFFYLMFPWLLPWLARLRLNRVLLAVAAFYFAEGGFYLFAHRLHDFSSFNQIAFFYQFPLPHLAEFVVGMGAAIWFSRGGKEWLAESRRATLVGVFSLVVLTALGFATLPFNHGRVPTSYPQVPFFALLILSLVAAPPSARWLAWPIFLLLGEASYSLYLVHGLCIFVLTLVHPSPFWAVVGLLVTIGISVLMFCFIERPIRDRIRAIWKSRRGQLRAANADVVVRQEIPSAPPL